MWNCKKCERRKTTTTTRVTNPNAPIAMHFRIEERERIICAAVAKPLDACKSMPKKLVVFFLLNGAQRDDHVSWCDGFFGSWQHHDGMVAGIKRFKFNLSDDRMKSKSMLSSCSLVKVNLSSIVLCRLYYLQLHRKWAIDTQTHYHVFILCMFVPLHFVDTIVHILWLPAAASLAQAYVCMFLNSCSHGGKAPCLYKLICDFINGSSDVFLYSPSAEEKDVTATSMREIFVSHRPSGRAHWLHWNRKSPLL